MLLELEQKTWGPQRWSGFILWEMIISVQNIKHGCRSKQAMGKQIRRQNGEWSSVVIALACQLKLAMFHSVLRRRKNARIIMLAAKGYMRRWWCSNSWSLMWAERSPCQSLFGKSVSIQRFGRQRQKTPQTFLQIIGRFFFSYFHNISNAISFKMGRKILYGNMITVTAVLETMVWGFK